MDKSPFIEDQVTIGFYIVEYYDDRRNFKALRRVKSILCRKKGQWKRASSNEHLTFFAARQELQALQSNNPTTVYRTRYIFSYHM